MFSDWLVTDVTKNFYWNKPQKVVKLNINKV